MRKESINDKEAICLLIAFIIGSTSILGLGGSAKNDAWIAAIVGILMAIPMLFIYCRTISLFQGQDLYEILNILFGNIIGRIVAIIYIFYAFHLGALVLRNFGEFIKIEAMPETPLFFSIFCMGIVCIFAVKLGIEVMGRSSAFFIIIEFFILAAMQLLAISEIHLNYIKPVLGNGIKPVLSGGFSVFSFPFAETVLFMGIFSSLRTKKSPYKVFRWAIMISGAMFILVTISNIGILGNMRGNFYFPNYASVSHIKIGDFLQRMEVTISYTFFFGVLFKSAVCLLVTSKGISRLFNLEDYRSIVIQTGLLMIFFAYSVYNNSMEMQYWAVNIYPYYAFPVQVILPVVIWIFAEIKAKKSTACSE